MIVSDNHVQIALEYLAIDPHPIALARKDTVDAENKSKAVFARLYLAADGSVATREAIATASPEYESAKAAEAEAILELECQRAKSRSAEMLIECWRSESANIRAAEKMR
jgi:hypothetical protein